MYLIIDELGARLGAFGRRLGGPPNAATTGAPTHAPAMNGVAIEREHPVRGRT